ncbi:MAG: CoA transferase [Acidimicrobiales bacterium]
MLADFGADVIKVEPPGAGDLLRHIGACHHHAGSRGQLSVASRCTEQAQHPARPEAAGSHRGAVATDRPGRCVCHQSAVPGAPLAGARVRRCRRPPAVDHLRLADRQWRARA